MHITEIEYNVVMQALNNARASIADNEFIDYYSENADMYTNEEMLVAIETLEQKLFNINPTKI